MTNDDRRDVSDATSGKTQQEGGVVLLPPGTLVVLCGISGCGKSTFAAANFTTTQIVSSDECRAILSDDPADQSVSGRAFELLHWITDQRLRRKRTTAVDSTALSKRARRDLLKIAHSNQAHIVLICFDIPLAECLARDIARERTVGPVVIGRQYKAFTAALSDIQDEDWDRVFVLSEEEAGKVRFMAQAGSFELRDLTGPFDVIGDLHGCMSELRELLDKLGYRQGSRPAFYHPEGRKLVFLGDLGDRGPDSAEAFALVMSLVEDRVALYTPGNHCNKLMRYLQGRHVKQTHGLSMAVEQVEARDRNKPGFKDRLRRFIENAPTYLWLDNGLLVVAHAGIKADMIGKDNSAVQRMCLYGDITGQTNPDGTPMRLDWAQRYTGTAAIVYGHTPKPDPVWVNNTINIDQGCVFGGWLSALRWPECETVSVRAHAAYYTECTPQFIEEAHKSGSEAENE